MRRDRSLVRFFFLLYVRIGYVFGYTPVAVVNPRLPRMLGQFETPTNGRVTVFPLSIRARPPWSGRDRWLLLGPERSGSAVHYDPLSTSAWNTLISGRKLWFLAPPYMSDLVDGGKDAENTACKWFIDTLPGLR